MSLLIHLVESYSGRGRLADAHDEHVGALDRRRLDRVLAYIEAHLESDLTVAELAEIACLSRHHFARAFREATGTPPHRYISARRLDYARWLLRGSHLSLAEIAFACRFSSQATFTRAFQRQLGVSPGAYRRRADL